MRGMLLSLSAALFSLALLGCAGTPPGPAEEVRKPGVTVDDKAAELQGLFPALHTLQDSLALDLLLAYRQLSVNASTGEGDREVARRGRNAYNQLEYLLRHGGLRGRGQDAPVITLPGGEKLTMGEFVDQLSKALLKAGSGGDWNSAGERAREIQLHKPELSALVEDAGWCLALSDALEGPLPEEVKKRLRFLHESYAMEVAHDEIVKQVNGLLPAVPDERLRRELKKLANRSWERDKRKGKFQEPQANLRPAGSDSTGAAVVRAPPLDGARGPMPEAKPDTTSSSSVSVAATANDSILKESKDRVDTLSLHGHYLEALRVLESVEGDADAGWIKDRRRKLGDRYCEERRAAAAASYSAARKAADDSTRVRSLRQSLGALDSCLFHFPDASVASKVRRNREVVEKELRPRQ